MRVRTTGWCRAYNEPRRCWWPEEIAVQPWELAVHDRCPAGLEHAANILKGELRVLFERAKYHLALRIDSALSGNLLASPTLMP